MRGNKNPIITGCIKDTDALNDFYNTMLEHWTVPMEKVHIPTSLGKTFCVKSGDDINPPIFSEDELSSLNMPVVYIGAKDDVLIDTDRSVERLLKKVSNARTLLLDEGHALVGLDDKVFELLV